MIKTKVIVILGRPLQLTRMFISLHLTNMFIFLSVLSSYFFVIPLGFVKQIHFFRLGFVRKRNIFLCQPCAPQ